MQQKLTTLLVNFELTEPIK